MMTLARAAIGIAALTATNFPAIAATQHDNDVFFSINGVQSFTYSETGYSVTSGQPYGQTTSSFSNNEGQITIQAGRNASTDVASWFTKQVGSGQTLVCDTKGTYPDQLNFASEGTLTIVTKDGETITCDNIIVAQGNFGQNNNWWMGGPGMKGVHISVSGLTAQFCPVLNHRLTAVVLFAPETPCVNHFTIGVIQLKKL